jgi:hypothetical protein
MRNPQWALTAVDMKALMMLSSLVRAECSVDTLLSSLN